MTANGSDRRGWPLPPTGVRMTSLAGYSPPERYRNFASSLTIWSYAGKMAGELTPRGRGLSPAERHPDRAADDSPFAQRRVDGR